MYALLFGMIPPLRLRENEDKGQIPGRLLRPPETRAGKGVPLQQIHHNQVVFQTRKVEGTEIQWTFQEKS